MQPPDSDAPAPRSPRRSAVALLGIGLLVVSSAFAVGALVNRGTQQGVLGSLFSGGDSSLDVAGITTRVAPQIVDITARFPDGLVAGTGMVITASGEVLTNNHVIESASAIEAQVGGTGAVYRARVVGSDAAADVALLQLEGASGLTTVSVSSASLGVGDPVVAVGNALGRSGPPSGSGGRVTALDRTITATDESGQTAETLDGLIEVDASILPGDSGGPLVDGAGRVVGMDTAASSRRFRFVNGGSEGFAIPIATAMAVARQIRSGGAGTVTVPPVAQTALLGVQLGGGGAGGSGALVVGVEPGSPADVAGIVPGDTIVSFAGDTVDSPGQLHDAVRAHRPGDRVQVGWVDGSGQQHSATVQLAAASA